jgi:predicted CXXCH cytochrome family protein
MLTVLSTAHVLALDAHEAQFKACISCHPEVKEALSKKGVHRPFMEFDCGSCHNPHAAKYEDLIRGKIDKLCKGCHEERAGEAGKINGHEPFRQGKCLA